MTLSPAPVPVVVPKAATTAAAEHPDWRASLRFERAVFFSDAVMAIAITLLLVDVRPPETGDATYEAALLAMLRQPQPFIAVAIGFFVLGSYWMSHRSVFTLLVGTSRGVLWANLVFLFGVAIQPFFTAALAAHAPNVVSVTAYAGLPGLHGARPVARLADGAAATGLAGGRRSPLDGDGSSTSSSSAARSSSRSPSWS